MAGCGHQRSATFEAIETTTITESLKQPHTGIIAWLARAFPPPSFYRCAEATDIEYIE